MTWRTDQLREDRHLRDAARALLDADLRNLRADLSIRSVGERALDRITEGASDLYDEALDVADSNKGILAAIGAVLILWLARAPRRDAFMSEDED